MDAAVERMIGQPGVFGARMTGGGFGGCIVALTEPGATTDGWVVRAVDGAARVE
jgi:galactokinase